MVRVPVVTSLRPTAANTQSAYVAFLSGAQGSEDRLFGLVGRLAKLVAYDTLSGSSRVTDTLEDVAQQATIEVWANLPTFKGKSEQFYSWVKRVCRNNCLDGFNKNSKESKLWATFEVEGRENPAVQGGIEFKRGGVTKYQQPRIQTPRKLPGFIQDNDLKICQYIREGYNYERIGEILSITESVVKKRVAAMRKGIASLSKV
jgi:DNA-directed RNA polymerase specialized sigma24 family protein